MSADIPLLIIMVDASLARKRGKLYQTRMGGHSTSGRDTSQLVRINLAASATRRIWPGNAQAYDISLNVTQIGVSNSQKA